MLINESGFLILGLSKSWVWRFDIPVELVRKLSRGELYIDRRELPIVNIDHAHGASYGSLGLRTLS